MPLQLRSIRFCFVSSLAAGLLLPLLASKADAGRMADCKAFAQKAVQQNRQNQDNNCGYSGALWHSFLLRHVRQCLGATRAQRRQLSHSRDDLISNCVNPRDDRYGGPRNDQYNDPINDPVDDNYDAPRNGNYGNPRNDQYNDNNDNVDYDRGRGRAPGLKKWLSGYGQKTGWSTKSHIRQMADVNGDGRADIVGFSDKGVYVSLSRNGRFAKPSLWVTGFGGSNGWLISKHPRMMVDVNGDRRADVVGFSDNGVYVALARRGRFSRPQRWTSGYSQGWTTASHVRQMADVNGDGRADIVGFADKGVYVSLSRRGRFTKPKLWVQGYGAGWKVSKHPRMMADVNGDGRADVVGFADKGVYVSLSRRGRFARPKLWVQGYGTGWKTSKHPRMMADVNGDGRADVVGFADRGVYVSLSRRRSFSAPKLWVKGYGAGWDISENPRILADINGDRRADIIGIAGKGVYTSIARRGRFSKPRLVVRDFGGNKGWKSSKHPRVIGDVNGDERADIVGFHDRNVYVWTGGR